MDENWHGRRIELFTARYHPRKKTGPDTRRRNSAGKLIGGHDSRRHLDVSSWIRRCWARAERRSAKFELRGYPATRSLPHWRGEYNWKGT